MLELSAYVHFPWCLQRCPYCDFVTAAAPRAEIPVRAYTEAVLAELSAWRQELGPVRLTTIFFGGGTPSLWTAPELGRVLAALRAWGGAPAETTVECNPSSLDGEVARALREQGVDRLSVGVQSLRDPHLRFLGRLHDAEGARRALREVARAGGLRLSADLIFGMAEHRREELLEDARELLDLGAEHLSAYALTVEQGTRFGELARKGRLPRLIDDEVAELYLALEAALGAQGLEHYEVSNYASKGARARHNEGYWRGEPYLGLGCGAVGCLPSTGGTAVRYRNDTDAASYLASGATGTPEREREELDLPTQVREAWMLGLRTADGLDLEATRARLGADPSAGREAKLLRMEAAGMLRRGARGYEVPRSQWLLVDEVIAAVF